MKIRDLIEKVELAGDRYWVDIFPYLMDRNGMPKKGFGDSNGKMELKIEKEKDEKENKS